MRSWHARHAWLGGSGAARDVRLEAENGVFTAVAPNRAAGDAEPLDGLVLPGLVNAHSHAFHRAIRGRAQEARGDFWAWREVMYGLAARLDPDQYRELATAVYCEMALAGITEVGEFHYLHQQPGGRAYNDPNEMGLALADAAAAAGIRMTLIDACYLTAGLDQPELDSTQERFSDHTVDEWAGRVDALAARLASRPLARMGVAVHSVRAVPPAALQPVAEAAAHHGVALHVHVSEQPAENEACIAATGLTPTALLAEHGVLGPTTTAVHATHLTEQDIGLLGASGPSVCLCPTTERDLGDGVGPGRALVDRSVRLCLGSDSHAVIDLFEEARAVELDERLVTGRRGIHEPAALLTAATTGGSEALGSDGRGLAVGAPADFLTVGLSAPAMAGFEPDRAAAAAVFAATAATVERVVVGGETIVANGRHQREPDVAGALERAISRLIDS